MNWFQQVISKLKQQGGLSDQGYVVANAEKLRDENPRSFSIPRSEQRRSLRVGDSAKIILEATNSDSQVSAERPWVIVTEVGEGAYTVKIDNNLALFPSLQNATITVQPAQIISVILPDEYVLPYGKSCLVSSRILNDDEWPHHLARVSPRDESDSGWRVYAENESSADASQLIDCDTLLCHY